MTISISKLRNNLKEILQSVQDGNKVEITQRGKIIAMINPPVLDAVELEKEIQYIRSNMWVGDVLSPLGEKDWTLDQSYLLKRMKNK